ncbi:hypothetical protein [Desulfopila sp. IMCC35008]|uniref:hypothetical protein n=1 Tax=Desulfopila sp. IMCC35008 TaxID=2653858 RepID=UPI0013D1B567|nr:hypothetical protein [Desulfopila sp. IMCC35008]
MVNGSDDALLEDETLCDGLQIEQTIVNQTKIKRSAVQLVDAVVRAPGILGCFSKGETGMIVTG